MKQRWWMFAVLLLGALGLAACGSEEPDGVTPPDVDTARLDEHRTLGSPIAVENLTVWPVYTDAPLDIGDFLTLQEAQAQKLAVVREIGDGGGANDAAQEVTEEPEPEGNDLPVQQLSGDAATVNKVVIENKGTQPILVCAGTIIQGGQQDRQIGQDFVIAAGETTHVDAFCVEQGRWALQTAADHEGMAARSADGETDIIIRSFDACTVAPKAVRVAGQYAKDQGEVWLYVRTSNTFFQHSDASNDSETLLGSLELAGEETKTKRARIEKTLADAFARLATSARKPVGFAYAINGKPVNVRAFAHERILRSQLPTFLTAIAMEAQLAAAGVKTVTTPAKASDVIAFMRAVEAAKEERVETEAANFNGYSANDVGYKARCYLELNRPNNKVGPDVVIITEDWTAK